MLPLPGVRVRDVVGGGRSHVGLELLVEVVVGVAGGGAGQR